jgi:hypothetical protein
MLTMVVLAGSACARLMSHAAGKRAGASWAKLGPCFEEEYEATERPVGPDGTYYVACKGKVWRCRGRGLQVAPECHPDPDTSVAAMP